MTDAEKRLTRFLVEAEDLDADALAEQIKRDDLDPPCRRASAAASQKEWPPSEQNR